MSATRKSFVKALVISSLISLFFAFIMYGVRNEQGFTLGAISTISGGCILFFTFVLGFLFLSAAQQNINHEVQVVHQMQNVADLIVIAQNKKKDNPIRVAAITVLGKLGNRQAVEPLVTTLQDKESSVRISAIEALGKLGDYRAIEPLIATLQDKKLSVRISAIEALGKLGNARAVEPLLALLQDKESAVRISVAEALGKLDDHRAVEPLTVALQDREGSVRTAAATALKQLVEVPKEEGTLPVSAVSDFEQLSDSRTVEPLLTALHDKESAVRHAAAQALAKLGDSRAVEPLLTTLQDEDASVRGAAVTALEQFGDSRAVEPLVAALWDSNSSVRALATAALKKLSNPEAVEAHINTLREKYASGQILVKTTEFTTKIFLSPKLPKYCVGCGGPPPLKAEAYNENVSVTYLSNVIRSGQRKQYLFGTLNFPLRFYLCETCAPKEEVMKPIRKRADRIFWIVVSITILLGYSPFWGPWIIPTLPSPTQILQQIASPWIGLSLLALLIVGPLILTSIVWWIVHNRLVSRKRPTGIGPQFEDNLVEFSTKEETVVGKSYSTKLIYKFSCDAYGEKFRDMNLNLIESKTTGDLHADSGIEAFNAGNYDLTVKECESAIEAGVAIYDLVEIHAILGRAYTRLKRYDKAIAAHKKAIELNPNYHEAWHSLGVAYRYANNFDEAEKCYKQSISIEPGNANVYVNLGYLYILKNEPQKTIEPIQEAIRLNPKLTDAHSNLTHAYAMLGRFDEAEASLNQAISLGETEWKFYRALIDKLKAQQQ